MKLALIAPASLFALSLSLSLVSPPSLASGGGEGSAPPSARAPESHLTFPGMAPSVRATLLSARPVAGFVAQIRAAWPRHEESSEGRPVVLRDDALVKNGKPLVYDRGARRFHEVEPLAGMLVTKGEETFIAGHDPDYKPNIAAYKLFRVTSTETRTFPISERRPGSLVQTYEEGRVTGDWVRAGDGRYYRVSLSETPTLKDRLKSVVTRANTDVPTERELAKAEAAHIFEQNAFDGTHRVDGPRQVSGANPGENGEIEMVRLTPGTPAYDKQLAFIENAGAEPYPLVSPEGKVVYKPKGD
jgi:hypothetical protein